MNVSDEAVRGLVRSRVMACKFPCRPRGKRTGGSAAKYRSLANPASYAGYLTSTYRESSSPSEKVTVPTLPCPEFGKKYTN